jgi:hypothetical protein
MGAFATPGIYLDQILSNVSQEFRNGGYAASEMFPRVPVKQISSRIVRYGFERFHRFNTARPLGGEAREMVRTNVNMDTYLCNPHDLKKLISDDERKTQAPGIEVDVTATQELTDAILLDIEFGAYNLVTTTAAIPQTTLTGGNQWSDYVNSDPIAAIEAQKRSVILGSTREANCLFLGFDVHIKLRQHPKIVDRFKYTAPTGVVNDNQLASAFGVQKIVVLKALYDASAGGVFGSVNATSSPLGFVWGKLAALAFIPEEPAVRTPTFGYSFWFSDDVTAGGPAIFRYRWEIRKGEFIEARSFWDMKILRPQAMFLWLAAVA